MKPSRAVAYLQILPSVDAASPTVSSADYSPSARPGLQSPTKSAASSLRLLPKDAETISAHAVSAVPPIRPALAEQLSLPMPAATDVLVIAMETVSLDTFVHELTSLRPRHVIDLRPVPFFNIEERRFDRRRAFAFFDEIGTTYHDLATLCLLEIKSSQDARLNPARLVPDLPERMGLDVLRGPLVVLLSNDTLVEDYTAMLPSLLPSTARGAWRARRL